MIYVQIQIKNYTVRILKLRTQLHALYHILVRTLGKYLQWKPVGNKIAKGPRGTYGVRSKNRYCLEAHSLIPTNFINTFNTWYYFDKPIKYF